MGLGWRRSASSWFRQVFALTERERSCHLPGSPFHGRRFCTKSQEGSPGKGKSLSHGSLHARAHPGTLWFRAHESWRPPPPRLPGTCAMESCSLVPAGGMGWGWVVILPQGDMWQHLEPVFYFTTWGEGEGLLLLLTSHSAQQSPRQSRAPRKCPQCAWGRPGERV